MCYVEGVREQVGVRELRQNLSVYPRRVAAGETLEVTERERAVAILAPLPEASTPLGRLVILGHARAPVGDLLELGPRGSGLDPVERGPLRGTGRAPSMNGALLYLGSSALVKLVLPEPETGALTELLSGWPERVSSALARVEVLRAVRRAGVQKPAYDRAENVVAQIGLIAVDERVLSTATRLDPPELRSLDAIHLATALSVPELGGTVSYDAWLAEAAKRSSIPALAPGAGG